jgi:pyrroloquinoline quinone biosynthesis protein B
VALGTRLLRAILLAALAGLASCLASPDAPAAAGPGPYVLVLGTAQDGGRPQLGCEAPCCAAVRAGAAERRLVTSLLLCDPRSGRRWLFDCTPDVREQVERARGQPNTRVASGPRPALFDGIFLTHAHLVTVRRTPP